MEDRTIIFLGIALVGFLITSLSGRRSLSIIISTCIGCILLYYPLLTPKELSDGHFIEKTWMVICFGLLPVVIIAVLGSYVGDRVSNLASKTKKPASVLWVTIILVTSIAVLMSLLLINRERTSNNFGQEVISQAKLFIMKQPEVLEKAGPIAKIITCDSNVKVGLFGKSINGFINCSVGGPWGSSWVLVVASGTTEAPRFMVKSVELIPHSQKYDLR